MKFTRRSPQLQAASHARSWVNTPPLMSTTTVAPIYYRSTNPPRRATGSPSSPSSCSSRALAVLPLPPPPRSSSSTTTSSPVSEQVIVCGAGQRFIMVCSYRSRSSHAGARRRQKCGIRPTRCACGKRRRTTSMSAGIRLNSRCTVITLETESCQLAVRLLPGGARLLADEQLRTGLYSQIVSR
jgi:hypothetical protein